MLTTLCLLSSLSAHALEPSVRSWLRAEALLEAGQPAAAVSPLEEAGQGAAAPLAALQLAMLWQAELADAPAAADAFVGAVDLLGGVDYDALRALSLAEPGTAPGFDRAVVSRAVYADTAAALTLHAAAVLDEQGRPAQAEALRARILAQWPDSADGRYLRSTDGVAAR